MRCRCGVGSIASYANSISWGGLAAAGATVGLIAGGLLTRYAGLAHRATAARRPAGKPLRGGWPLISWAAGHAAFRPIRCDSRGRPLGGPRRARISRRHSEPGGASVRAAARSVVIMQQIGGDVAVEYGRDPLAQPAEREDDHAGSDEPQRQNAVDHPP